AAADRPVVPRLEDSAFDYNACMRTLLAASVLAAWLVACHSSAPPKEPTAAAAPPAAAPAPTPTVAAAPPTGKEHLAADTPKTTTEGSKFIGPADWDVTVKGSATIVSPTEDGNWIALVDVHAPDADAAVKLAWAAYKPDAKWPLKVVNTAPDREGWTKIHTYDYEVSPNERRIVRVNARSSGGDAWTVVILDMQQAVVEKRGGQIGVLVSHLQPKGFERESFAGKAANKLDDARIAALGKFVDDGLKTLDVPGVGMGVVQDGKVVFAGGFGVKTLGKPGKPTADTLFMIASNTKAMTTLLLAKLVDAKKLAWDTPVTPLLPSFRLGSAATTSKVLAKPLICACTGMPRQDLEWLFQFGGLTPKGALAQLGTMEPTSKFGELFQYSNPMAAAAGYVGGSLLYPKLEL